jgi:chromosome condensin MukBEF MukE localization factor
LGFGVWDLKVGVGVWGLGVGVGDSGFEVYGFVHEFGAARTRGTNPRERKNRAARTRGTNPRERKNRAQNVGAAGLSIHAMLSAFDNMLSAFDNIEHTRNVIGFRKLKPSRV